MDNLQRITPLPKASRLAISGFGSEPLLSAEDKLCVIECLQDSQDLNSLLKNFAAQVARFVRFMGIKFQSKFGIFNQELKKQAKFSEDFNLLDKSMTNLGVISYQSPSPFNKLEVGLLAELHRLLTAPLRLSLRLCELRALALKDHLTGIGNRAYYDEVLSRAIEQNVRRHQGLALILLDLNNFKMVNDTLGHQQGDQVLVSFAQLLQRVVRNTDMPFRLGGDEFALLLQPTTADSIEIVTRRLNKAVQTDLTLTRFSVSASLGWSNWVSGKTASDLFHEADKAMYKDKLSHKR